MLDARTNKVMNKPTDGFADGIYDMQRAVQNSLWVVAKDDTPSGIDGIKVDDNGDTTIEFYNLQGVRVAHPSSGLFIRRCGSKVTKIAF